VDEMFIEPGSDIELISPREFVDDRVYPEDGIIIFTEYMADAIKQYTDFKGRLTYSNKPYSIKYRDIEFMLIYPFYGAPATIVAFEIAIAYGLKRAIAVGEAGAVKPGVRIGEYILPAWGVREEGTSYHYMPPDYIPRIGNNLYKSLLSRLRREGVKVYEGGVWSIDAIFRETLDKIRRYRDMGVLCVDMESTALMAVADYRGIEIAILLVASDELYHGKWVSGWRSELLKEAEYNAVRIALDTLAEYK